MRLMDERNVKVSEKVEHNALAQSLNELDLHSILEPLLGRCPKF